MVRSKSGLAGRAGFGPSRATISRRAKLESILFQDTQFVTAAPV